MDFAFSEEQEMLRTSVRDFLTTECPKSVVRELEASELGHSPELWRKMAELGWMGLMIPEEYGGAGYTLLELAVLFEEFGRAAMPGPMFSTMVLGTLPILEGGTEEQKGQLLPQIASGELILTMALSEPEMDYELSAIATRAIAEDGGFAITGTKLFVPYAHIANYLIVVTKTKETVTDSQGISVFIVDGKAPGISLIPLTTIAADKQFELQFDRASASSSDILGGLDSGSPLIKATLQKATAVQCAQMVGGAQQELEMTAEYTKTRVQFDRPIGTFQAVQHRLADMLTDVNGARWTTYHAVWRLNEGLPATREVAIAKAFTSSACQRVAASAQQLHGGIGVDVDYDLHFYYRRAKALELSFGATPYHIKALESELGL